MEISDTYKKFCEFVLGHDFNFHKRGALLQVVPYRIFLQE
jgi:hypothetical protein